MEDDTELIFCGGICDFNNTFQESADTSVGSSFSETAFSPRAFKGMDSYRPLSIDAGQLLPSETSSSSQSLHQGPTASYGERNTGMPYPYQVNENFRGCKRPSNNTARHFACGSEDISSVMDFSHWPETFQPCVDLDQYASQLGSLFECSPTFGQDTSAPPTTPDTQNFELTSQVRPSTVPRPPLESPAPMNASIQPVSPADSMESCVPIPSNAQYCSPANAARSAPDNTGNFGFEDDTDAESVSCEEPYAKLIFRALMSVPGHRMALKDIYGWFEKHTSKAKNSDTKGWQNSIRHNLSMNAAFEGSKDVTSSGGSPKKGPNVWVLTEEAIKNGVQSTTRYRKQAGSKKSQRSEHPAPQRQRSGAKGGRAAKKSAKTRRALLGSPKRDQMLLTAGITSSESHSGPRDLQANYTTSIAEYPLPSVIATPRFPWGDNDISRIIECANLPPNAPIFYHDDSSTNCYPQKTDFPTGPTGQAVGPDCNTYYRT